MESEQGQRSRARDWWRWAAILSPPGGLGVIVVALARRRWVWALVLTLAVTGEAAAIVVAIHRAPHVMAGHNGPEGIAVILGVLVCVLAWCFPAAGAGRRSPAVPWPAVTERGRQLTARYGLGAYVVALGSTLLLGLLLRAAGVRVGLAVGVMIIDTLLLASLLPLIRRGRLGRRDLGLRATRPGASAGLACASLVVYIALAVAWTLVVIHPATRSQSFSKQLGITAHPGSLAVILDVFALAVCAPVCEEIFFRGLLFRSLRNRLPLWAAALIAGSLFGLAHIGGYPLNTIPIKMLFGVLMCLLYERTGSLLPCIAVHSFVDGSTADALFSGNLSIAFGLAGLALLIVAMRTLVTASRSRYPPPPWRSAMADPGAAPPPTDPHAPWPPWVGDH